MKKLLVSCLALFTICSTTSFSQLTFVVDGRLGVGKTSPRDIFHVKAITPNLFYECDSSSLTSVRYVEHSTNFTGAYIKYNASPNKLILGIHPAYSSSTNDDDDILIIDGADGSMRFYPQNSGSYHSSWITYAKNKYTKCYEIERSSIQNFWVYGNGDVYHKGLNTISDASLKENIQSIPNSIDLLTQLRPVKFNFKAGAFGPEESSDESEFGLIAQEVEEIIPELVTTRDDGLKAISYLELIPMLIDAMQSQQKEITALKNQVASFAGTAKKNSEIQASVHV